MSILDSAPKQTISQRAVLIGQHWWSETAAPKTTGGGLRSSENQRTTPEKGLRRKRRWNTIPLRPIFCARDYPNQVHQQALQRALAGHFGIEKT